MQTGTSFDELRVWNRAFTSTEVAALQGPLCSFTRTAPPFPANLLVHARFYGTAGLTTPNLGSLGGDGTVSAVAWQTNGCP